tara:strand:- start:11100 stop:11414 length:315 start_codon:yes stop_codon:yes gene_type:complete
MTYEWNCKTVDVYTTKGENTDVVYTIHYRVEGSKEGFSTTSIGTQSLNTDNLEGFTSFDTLKHRDLIAWTKSAMGPEKIAEIKNNLRASVDALITPITKTITIS